MKKTTKKQMLNYSTTSLHRIRIADYQFFDGKAIILPIDDKVRVGDLVAFNSYEDKAAANYFYQVNSVQTLIPGLDSKYMLITLNKLDVYLHE